MALRDVLIKRIAQAIVTIFIVLAIDFVIFHILPGDPMTFLARNPNLSEVAQARLVEQFGLDKPLWQQFILFLGNFLTLQLGMSFHFRADVGPIIMEHLGNTLILIIPASLVAIFIGIWIGKNSAWRRGKPADFLGLLFSLITYSIPVFWLAMFFIMTFAFGLGWFPGTPGLTTPGMDFTGDPFGLAADMLSHLMLPWTVLTIAILGSFALITRNALLDVLSEDYMVTAKAKGRTEKEQLNKEAMPNAMIPITTVIALQLGFSVAGALQTEVVFSYPGIGNLIWEGVYYRDYPLLQAAFFMITVVVVIANLLADFIYFYLDPRIRVGAEFTIGDEKPPRPFSHYAVVVIAIVALLSTWAVIGITTVIPLIILLLIVKRKDIVQFLGRRLGALKPANLIYAWRNKRSQILIQFSAVALVVNLIAVSIIAVTGILSPDWWLYWGGAFAGLGSFPPPLLPDVEYSTMALALSSIAHPSLAQIAIVGAVIGILLGRRKGLGDTFGRFIRTRMGMAGTAIVAMFAGMTIFGDIVAPYDPEAFFTGLLYQAPSSMPEMQLLMVSIGIASALGAGIVWLILDRIKRPPIPRFFVTIYSGGLILFIAGIFGVQSLSLENTTTLVFSAAIGVIAGIIILRGLLSAKRNFFIQDLKSHLPRLVIALVGVVSIGLIVLGILQAPRAVPLDFPGNHLIGTDQLGRDVFSQMIIAVRITLLVGIVATGMSMIIGTLVGLVAGYYGGIIDSFLMRFTDIFFVIPSLLLMIILAAVLGPSIVTLILVIGLFSWSSTARIVRGQVLTIKERAYIERVRAVGGGNVYIMSKHVLAAVAPLVVANTILVTAWAILSEVVLDFFGLGDPSMISWGTMLYLAFNAGAMSNNFFWLVFPPGIMVVLLLLGVSMVGYAMDEIVNPKLRRR
ncbi:MAG: ABC transporter permease subunit [Candidatus Thorarchaeota archaeon]|nr:ABC transporter permease subunit [Candidatus Thorarchaeota archaeon]